MESTDKKTTAPASSVGADAEQSNKPNTTDIISNETPEINRNLEICPKK